jgi:hypothetical protein
VSRPFPGEEPRADIRQFAKAMREMYVALQQEGFTVHEAMTIIAQVIAAGVGGQQGGGS